MDVEVTANIGEGDKLRQLALRSGLNFAPVLAELGLYIR
jgi:hypothetical protein